MTVADITTELATIAGAQYGRDVRTAMHDGLQKVNNDIVDSGEYVVTASSTTNTALEFNTTNAAINPSGGRLAIRKIGKVVFLTGYRLQITNASGYDQHSEIVIANILRSEMRAKSPILFPISYITTSSGYTFDSRNCVLLNSNGDIKIKIIGGPVTDNNIAFHTSYCVD